MRQIAQGMADGKGMTAEPVGKLLREIRACRICAAYLPHGVRPVIHASARSKICIVAQAPGIRVHETGISFNDPSGDRLREWMGIGRDVFYDDKLVAIIGMGFCFPGWDDNGGDLPPRKECAPAWQDRLFAALPPFKLKLLVGTYAIRWHLNERAKANVSATVKAWREYGPAVMPLPHPSWRNNAWLAKNPWFGDELLPALRRRVKQALRS